MPGAALCVYCRTRPVDARWRPFCSERCRMADLGRWLGGDYRIAGSAPEPAGPGDEGDDDLRDARSTGGR